LFGIVLAQTENIINAESAKVRIFGENFWSIKNGNKSVKIDSWNFCPVEFDAIDMMQTISQF